MTVLNVDAFQADVISRAAELIALTNAGRQDRHCRDARFFVMSELRQVSDVLAMETLKSAQASMSEIGAILPEAYESKPRHSDGTETLGDASRSAFLTALSDRGLEAARPFMLEHTAQVSLADIVNVLQKGFSRVAKRRGAADVFGRIDLYAGMFIENPTLENFQSLIAEGAYLDAALEQEHSMQYEKNPHRKSSFQDISRAVFEMHSIGREIVSDTKRFEAMVEAFKADVENDKVEIYYNNGINCL